MLMNIHYTAFVNSKQERRKKKKKVNLLINALRGVKSYVLKREKNFLKENSHDFLKCQKKAILF